MSVTVRLYDHPFAGVAPTEHSAPSVAAWLLARYGTQPQKRIEVYRGQVAAENDISQDRDALLSDEPAEYTVLELPGAELTALQIFSIIVTVFSVAQQLLATRPTTPSNLNRTSASPNNDLGERTNQVRVLQRIEDIFGTVLAVPSLMMPTYNKYIDNVKVEFGYYCVGRGYYTINRVRDSDTLISDITGSSAAIYLPFTSPNSGDAPQQQIGSAIIDPILTVERSESVDGITLKALNQIQLGRGASYAFAANGSGSKITQGEKRPNFNAIFNPSDEITIKFARTVSVTGDPGTSSFVGDFLVPDPETPVDTGGGGDGSDGGGDA